MSTTVYSFGLVYCSVCSDEPIEDMLRAANRSHPTGLSHGWVLSDDPTFAAGGPNPGPCDEDSTKTHYLLVC